MSQISWDVFIPSRKGLGLIHIDTVIFNAGCDADYVKRSLIDHDGYSRDIVLRRLG